MKDTQRKLDPAEDKEIEAAWAIEIERRMIEVESGAAETVDWEDARARIRATLAKS